MNLLVSCVGIGRTTAPWLAKLSIETAHVQSRYIAILTMSRVLAEVWLFPAPPGPPLP